VTGRCSGEAEYRFADKNMHHDDPDGGCFTPGGQITNYDQI
jgi:hypothetical protein